MVDMPPDVVRANLVVVMACQSLLGYVRPELRGLAVRVTDTSVTMLVAVSEQTEAVDEMVDDITAEFEVNMADLPQRIGGASMSRK
jgi:hypothetical protein